MVVFALAHFGMSDMADIGRMTMYEFRLRKQAYLMNYLDTEEQIHRLAFANRTAKATNKKGDKYIFPNFKDFYNSDKRRKEVLGDKEKIAVHSELIARARRLQNMRGGNDG
ncbi:hypothetical protein MKL29_01095 [Streptococcus suis]|nr:hypothetical protein [Streptococcus suis]